MALDTSILLEVCIAGFVLTSIAELFLTRRIGTVVLQIALVGGLVLLALLVNNAATGRIAFGESTPPLRAVSGMLVCVILGVLARYLFYMQKGQFSWLDLLKPVCISPIVLLPLMGSLQGSAGINDTQLVSLLLLAFQNGFFWQSVLQTAKSKTRSRKDAGIARRLACLALLTTMASIANAQSRPAVPPNYTRFFIQYADRRPMAEKMLNLVGVTSNQVGRSFALIAGVTRYPNMSPLTQDLQPAAADLRQLQAYLKDQEVFDEIVLLKDGDMNYENLRYFLEIYFAVEVGKLMDVAQFQKEQDYFPQPAGVDQSPGHRHRRCLLTGAEQAR
jgi:hypothetical protein